MIIITVALFLQQFHLIQSLAHGTENLPLQRAENYLTNFSIKHLPSFSLSLLGGLSLDNKVAQHIFPI